ncbi:unnamed protein product [Rotaria sordida]|uniref:Sphingomyelin phosphodiesterase n=1 Tax=Rotaria sordida TaxID=392033 RepID=A0A818VS31_9BILA|nr:unnamed protein product [Rotaria sordida]CAF3715100.1 unnamed protein product [Rotaria sordida]
MLRSCYIFVLFCFFTINILIIESRSISDDTIETILSDPLNDNHRKLLHTFTSYRHRFEQSANFKALRWTLGSQKTSGLCDLCDLGVPVIRLLLELNQTSLIDEVVNTFCREYILLDENVCRGAAYEYMGAVFQVIELTSFTNKQLCALAFECQPQRDFPIFNWNVTFPDKPKPTPQPPQPPSPDSPKLNILHLSDLHVDFSYKPGSQADCSQPLCCREGQPVPSHKAAGFWGDYRNCDVPFWTAEALLKYAAEIEKVDFIYYTGDLPAHNVWNQSRTDQLYSINTINNMLATIFSNKTFYSAVGNHEAAPCNLYPTPNIRTDNISWLYETLADNWIKLGLSNDTRDSILHGAFYTTLIRPGLRLISLNMNYCTSDNFWLIINATDPLGQLQWLIQWLQYAEDHEEKVHLIGHQPPRSCFAVFSWNFNKIINRYENTIAGQFYGHAHSEELMIFYDEINRQRPVSMAYIGPSVTTYSYLNPGYRVYTIDGDYQGSSFWTLDYHTVIMNLTASNMYNQTIFLKEYDARDAYQMENLFPNDWNNLIQRLENDIDGPLMGTVYQHYTKSYEDGSRCDHNCRRGLICDFKSARSEDPHACDSIPPFN